MFDRYVIGIVFIPGEHPKKYVHNIRNSDRAMTKFCQDMKRRFSGAHYVNFYGKTTGTFLGRTYLPFVR